MAVSLLVAAVAVVRRGGLCLQMLVSFHVGSIRSVYAPSAALGAWYCSAGHQCTPRAGLGTPNQHSQIYRPLSPLTPHRNTPPTHSLHSPRFDVTLGDMDKWANNLLPSRQFGYIVLTTSAGIMDHEEARRKHTGGKVLGYFY